MPIEFTGEWPDKREQIQVAVNLLWIDKKPEVWEVSLMSSDDPVLTLNAVDPMKPSLGESLKVMMPDEMHVRPRYSIRRKDWESHALCASNASELVFVMIVFYSLGEQALSNLVTTAMPPTTPSA